MAGTPDVLSGTFARRYVIDRELGRGATATVYLARDTERGRNVAIKVLKPELAQSVGAGRFLKEIRLNQQLHHPHIVQVLDSGEHEGMLYFVLPHMEGGSLRDVLQREKQLPVAAAIAITRTVADALQYAHAQGFIHRDVKPENILFTSGQACLADFGIARAIERAIDESTTDTGLVRGTPAYMSPEQASGSKDYDGRSDVYSLACVFYEMVAGVPAFIGPTPEAVIAQRFQHPPRDLRVYRPAAPSALESVLQRALQLSPVDRFESALAFADALEAAAQTPTIEKRVSGPSVRWSPQRRFAFAGASLFVVGILAVGVTAGRAMWGRGATASDSTLYAVLPIEGADAARAEQAGTVLHQAMSGWAGITVVDRFAVRDAIGGDGVVRSDREAIAVARKLGAGRLIRTQLTTAGSELRAYSVLMDARAERPIAQASTVLPVSLVGADRGFASLTRALLLPGIDSTAVGSRNVHAVRAFDAGVRALSEFDLTRADTLLTRALDHDRQFARAALWLAQTRSWQSQSTAPWKSFAEMAAGGGSLDAREQQLLAALLAMSRGEYPAACDVYERMRRADERDFIAWYGLGQCRQYDNAVLPDARSASGWRFRSSYHRAVLAYARAFELAPSLHRSFSPGAFARLRKLLYTSRNILRTGAALSPQREPFLAYPTWAGDSLAFIPYPAATFRQGMNGGNPEARARSVLHQRQLFAQIAHGWSTAMPRNAGAKEAVAIALDMLGDASAIDTMRLARTLATDDQHRLRLAAEQAMLGVSFGRTDRARLRSAMLLVDSLLRQSGPTSREDARIVAPLAALRGECARAASLAAMTSTAQDAALAGIPQFALAMADSMSVSASMQCDRARADDGGIDRLLATVRSSSTKNRDDAEYQLIGRALAMSEQPDTTRLKRVASASGDPLLKAIAAAITGSDSTVLAYLEGRRRVRGALGTAEVTPDVVVAEARLWLSLRDTAAAVEWLDPPLSRVSWLDWLQDPVNAGSLIRMEQLRVEIARARRDVERAAAGESFLSVVRRPR